MKQIIKNKKSDGNYEVLSEKEIAEIMNENKLGVTPENSAITSSFQTPYKTAAINLNLIPPQKIIENNPIQNNLKLSAISKNDSELEFKISPDKKFEGSTSNFLSSGPSSKMHIEDFLTDSQKDVNSAKKSQPPNKKKTEIEIIFEDKIESDSNSIMTEKTQSKNSNNNKLFNFTEKINLANGIKCPHCNQIATLTDGSNFITCVSIYCRNKKSFCKLCEKPLNVQDKKDHYPKGIYMKQCLNFDIKKILR